MAHIGLIGPAECSATRLADDFRAMPGVTLSSVEDHDDTAIESLLSNPQVSGVVVGGRWDRRAARTLRALEAGKHVLCDFPFATSPAEGRKVIAAAEARPKKVARLIPSRDGLATSREIWRIAVDQYFIGELQQVIAIGPERTEIDYTKPLTWRHSIESVGCCNASLGQMHLRLLDWIPQAQRVFARTMIYEPERAIVGSSKVGIVTAPDSAHVLADFPKGARGVYLSSSVVHASPKREVWLMGQKGTIRIEFGAKERIFVGRHSESELHLVEPPADRISVCQAAKDFIDEIHGDTGKQLIPLSRGLEVLEFLEAVHRSSGSGQLEPVRPI